MEQQVIKVAPGEKKIYLKELDKFILIRPYISYEDHEINILDPGDKIIRDQDLVKRYERDREAEQEFISQVKGHIQNSRRNRYKVFSACIWTSLLKITGF